MARQSSARAAGCRTACPLRIGQRAPRRGPHGTGSQPGRRRDCRLLDAARTILVTVLMHAGPDSLLKAARSRRAAEGNGHEAEVAPMLDVLFVVVTLVFF